LTRQNSVTQVDLYCGIFYSAMFKSYPRPCSDNRQASGL